MALGYGAYLDDAGRLLGLPVADTGFYGATAPEVAGTGLLRLDGSLEVPALARLLNHVKTEYGPVALAMPSLAYDRLALVQHQTDALCVSVTQAMTLQHAVHCLPAGCDLKVMALDCTTRRIEVGLFDCGDGVVEDLALRVERSDMGSTADTIRGLVRDAFRDAGLSLPPSPPFIVIMAAEDAAAYEVVEGVLGELFCREAAVVRKSSRDIVMGAADRIAIRTGCGYTRDVLTLALVPHAFKVVVDGVEDLFIERNTTIPTLHSCVYEMGPGCDLRVEVVSPYRDDAPLIYRVPRSALRNVGVVDADAKVELSIDIEFNMTVRVMLKGPNGKMWQERLDALTLWRGSDEPAQAPDELMRLIGLLDEVDLGMKNVSSDALKTPAGQVASTLQARLLDLIAEVGGTYYQALGQTFDPHVHEAAAIIDNPVFPANYVVEEIKRGFRYHGKIVRYSVVRVANPR